MVESCELRQILLGTFAITAPTDSKCLIRKSKWGQRSTRANNTIRQQMFETIFIAIFNILLYLSPFAKYLQSKRHIRSFISKDMANTIACSAINSRLDWCYAILPGVAEYNILLLKWAQNCANWVICGAPYGSSETNLLKELDWLPVRHRI